MALTMRHHKQETAIIYGAGTMLDGSIAIRIGGANKCCITCEQGVSRHLANRIRALRVLQSSTDLCVRSKHRHNSSLQVVTGLSLYSDYSSVD